MNYLRIISISLLALLGMQATAQDHQKIWHWMQQLGGSGWDMSNGIAIDGKDNVYIAGAFTEVLQGAKKDLKSEGNRDVYVARYNSKGKLQWLWQAGGEHLDKISAIKAAPDNDLYIAGLLEGEMKFGKEKVKGEGKKLFVARINKRGKSDWVYTLPYSGAASAYLLETDKNGNLICGGMFTDSLNCVKTPLMSQGHNDIFVARISPEGQLNDLKHYGGKGKERLSALATDSLGHIYLAGHLKQSLDFDELKLPVTDKKENKSFVVQLDSTLEAQWVKTFSSPTFAEIRGMACDHENRLLLGGSFQHQLGVDTLLFNTQGLSDVFVSQLDTLGQTQWLKTFGGEYNDYCTGLKLNKLRGAMLSGSFSDSLMMDSLIIKTKSLRPDAFIAQMDTAGVVTWAGALQGDGGSLANGSELDSRGNLYLMGSFNGELQAGSNSIRSLGDEDIFVARYYNCPPVSNAIKAPDYLCQGAEATLYVDKNYSHVVWNDTLTDVNKMLIQQAGTYHVSMVDKKGCVVNDSVEIKEVIPMEFSLGADTMLLVSDQLKLSGPELADAYLWQDGSILQTLLAYSENEKAESKDYALTITDSLGCQQQDTIRIEFFKNTVSNDPNEGERLITIYPNPVEADFYWSFDEATEGTVLTEITDLKGQVLRREKIGHYIQGGMATVSVNSLQAGVYYFCITCNGKRFHKKFVKK